MKLDLNYIIIYGPKLHSHPNSWIFYGFYRAFVYKRYNVIWVNQETQHQLDEYDLSNSLFFTDGIHDDNIPLLDDCVYILYNNYKTKYNGYTKLHINQYRNDIGNYQKWKDLDYIRYSLETNELFFPLATELLPEEILKNQQTKIFNRSSFERNIAILYNNIENKEFYADIKKVCNDNFYKILLINNFDQKDRICSTMCSEISPVIHSQDQIEHNEINAEIFQIISYGGFPVTNSEYTSNLFPLDCVYYSDNTKDLILEGIEHKNNVFGDLCKWNIMEYIKNNHTYIKRIDTIFWMLVRM